MTPLALGLMAVALLLLAAGMLLWQHAVDRRRQDATSAFVDRQLRSIGETHPATEAPGMALPSFMATAGQSLLWRHLWRHLWLRAGLMPGKWLYARLLLPAVALAAAAAFFGGILSVIGVLALYAMLMYFRLWLKAARRHRKMVHQLPGFLDTMVRLSIIGNSLEAAFQAALPTTEAPLQELLGRANHLIQAGMDLESALAQEARLFRLPELALIAAIIGVALRFGGRADMVLERMAGFMRDREHAQNEMTAMSAEIRLSAWILGLLPIGLGIFLIIFNNDMFMLMLHDPLGEKMLTGAVALEAVGAYWLYRLAKSV